jgi:hypothetical protein
MLFVSRCCTAGDRPAWERLATTHYQVLGSEAVTSGLSVGQRVRRAGMRKREVIEFRKVTIKLRPIRCHLEQAILFRSISARSEKLNRNQRTRRVLHSTTTEQERSCVLHENGTRGKSLKRGFDRMEHRKSDEFVVAKKDVKAFGAKGLGRYRIVSELLSQIRGWK